MNPLQIRLAALRRRLRIAVSFRGLCLLASMLLGCVAIAGLLDWRMQLPPLARAALLVACLGSAGLAAVQFLIRPLRMRADDLTLAIRLETVYPSLADSLASTIEFLGGGSESSESAELRQSVVARTMRESRSYDFHKAIETRGLGRAGLSLIGSAALAIGLLLWQPGLAWTALVRLADPFGEHDWPRQTSLDVEPPRSPVARGEPYEIRATIEGVIPSEATVIFAGPAPSRQTFAIGQDGRLTARLDRVEESFGFQVIANDASSRWYDVKVLPPPVLVALEGRASPQLRLHYPVYTCVTDRDLPDGAGTIDTVAGTQVSLRAATDRPIARAWIAYRPDRPAIAPAAFLTCLGASNFVGATVSTAAGFDIWGNMPVHIDATGHVLSATFVPRVSGAMLLRFEEESALGNTRLFDVRVRPDPAPAVNLERPSRSHDNGDLLRDAEVEVRIAAEDREFGLRTVYLEVRCGKNEPSQRLVFHDHQAVMASGRALPAGGAVQVRAARRLPLASLRHADGRPLAEGDVIVLQAYADDFDDVSLNKQPGHSHEVELRIVGRQALEADLDHAQKRVQQELLRLQKLHQEASDNVISPEQRWRSTGRLGSRDLDQLAQAQELEHQLRARVGSGQEGLRGDVGRLLERLQENRLPPSGMQERIETVAGELDRLVREHLQQLESDLTNARKESEVDSSLSKPTATRGRLGEARRHQEEVAQTLAELLKLLEPWGNVNEARGEARAVLQEQRRLAEETEALKGKALGRQPEGLDDDTKASLGKAAEMQGNLGQRVEQLLQKMGRVGRENRDKSPDTAAALAEAAAHAEKEDVAGQMKAAAEDLRGNRLVSAGDKQRQSTRGLERMVRDLEERREQELDQLKKKLRQAEEMLTDLEQRQQSLRKKIAAAGKIADPAKRREELKRLGREQQQLQKEAQEMARELTRLRAERAAQGVAAVSESMEQAATQLQSGEEPAESQEEVLDRMQEARQRLRQQQARVEEELQRERLAKLADQLRLLGERQEATIRETKRLHDAALEQKEWTRPLRASLGDLIDAQSELAQETDRLAKDKLADAKVLPRLLAKAAAAMTSASQQLQKRRDQIDDNSKELRDDGEIHARQDEALRRIRQLLQAVKSESAARSQTGGGEGAGEAGGGRPPQASDRPGHLAELKALWLLQQEVNERTSKFSRAHPDVAALSERARRELAELGESQRELADLLDQVTALAGGGDR
jgi:DNA repair exonuclease SbcCD ATPase subunit